LVLASVALGGCGFFFEPQPDLDNKKTAKVAGLSVEYPGNWTTEQESEELEGVTFSSLTIESSGNAIAVIQVFEPGVDFTPKEIFDTYIEGMKEAAQTELGGVFELSVRGDEDFSRDILGNSWQGRKGVVEIGLLGEKVPNRLQTVQRHRDEQTVVIIMQGPVEDWKTIEPGFEAIYAGLSE
jgi:hypothetical protein